MNIYKLLRPDMTVLHITHVPPQSLEHYYHKNKKKYTKEKLRNFYIDTYY